MHEFGFITINESDNDIIKLVFHFPVDDVRMAWDQAQRLMSRMRFRWQGGGSWSYFAGETPHDTYHVYKVKNHYDIYQGEDEDPFISTRLM